MPKFDDAKVRAVCNAMLIEAEKAQSDARWVQLVRTADRLAHIGAPYEPDLTREEMLVIHPFLRTGMPVCQSIGMH
jgi:hypothetical protein